jgi:integrase
MVEFGRMLNWFYDSPHGEHYRRLSGLNKALLVRKAKSTSITTYNEQQLKSFFRKADAHERLLLLLCLNCGMYAADIGRLKKTEINLEKGFFTGIGKRNQTIPSTFTISCGQRR